MSTRCRACPTNDREALIDEIAERMWERHRDPEFEGDWDSAGDYWQRIMREHARATLDVVLADAG